MGLRQSKRSVDISGSPKKEAPAAVAEKSILNNDFPVIDGNEGENKSTANGEAKTVECELEKSVIDETKDSHVAEVADESKGGEGSPSAQKEEKKEKVKKKRSFRSFSFLRREKKTKEEHNKNGDVTIEAKIDNAEPVVSDIHTLEAIMAEGPAAAVAEVVVDETLTSTPKIDEAAEENKDGAPLAAVEDGAASEPVPETAPESVESVSADVERDSVCQEEANDKENYSEAQETNTVSNEETTVEQCEDITHQQLDADPIQETDSKAEVAVDDTQSVQASEE